MNQLKTQCPSCHATYPMPEAKLGDPNAKAKCGRCQEIFLLNDHLLTPEQENKKAGVNLDAFNAIANEPIPEQPKRRTKREKPVPTGDVIHDDMFGEEEKPVKVAFSDNELDSFLNSDVHVQQPVTSTLDEQKSQQDDESWVRDLLDDSKPSVATQNSIARTASTTQTGIDFDNFIPVATAPTTRKNVGLSRILAKKDPTAQEIASQTSMTAQLLWLLGCVLLLAVLATQYVFFNINTIAKNPAQAGMLESVCAIAPCTIPKADLSNISIESTHTSENYTTNIVVTIKNKGSDPTLFPNFVVTTKDVNGVLLGDFVVTTEDYVSEAQSSLLSGQHKRAMFTINTAKFVSTVDIKPFY